MRYWKFKDRPYVPGQGRTWPEPVSKWTKLGVYWETADEFDADGNYNGTGWLRTHCNDDLPSEIFTEVDGNGADGEIVFKLWGEDRSTSSCGLIHPMNRCETSIKINGVTKARMQSDIDAIDDGLTELSNAKVRKMLQDIRSHCVTSLNKATDELAKDVPALAELQTKKAELLAQREALK